MSKGITRAALIVSAVVFATAASAQNTGNLLVTAQQLSNELRDPALVLLQVGPKEDYEKGHIPGARLVTLRDIAVDDEDRGRVLDLPDENDLRARLERLGIGDRSQVVVIFGDEWGSPATRLVWTLQAAGLGARTRLLDGGSRAWTRAGLALTKSAPAAPAPAKLTLSSDRSIVVDHAWMQAHQSSPGIRIVDGRAPVFFEGPGMPEHNHGAGHLAGAVNIPFNTLTDDSMHIFPVAELRRKFAAAGVQAGDTIAAYCHIGQQATMVLFAARLLGHPIRLYDGSMNDWERRKLPLVNPTAPKKSGDDAPARWQSR
jgi:thiosulfate/3-mercaptopyruvate sulfurtransferase